MAPVKQVGTALACSFRANHVAFQGGTVQYLVLASASPFRRQLLQAAGIQVKTQAALLDETKILHPSPAGLATARAEAKALAVAGSEGLEQGTLVIGADQVLELEGEAFDKVVTADAAIARLSILAGRQHFLHSAFCFYWRPPQSTPSPRAPQLLCSLLESTAMPMRALTAPEIAAYVSTGEWQGSVGCYQFENRGMQLFEAVYADQATIVGLPVQRVAQELRAWGINPLLQPDGPWTLQ